MDHLRSSIGLQGYAQVDPKVEYKREGMRIFGEMWNGIADRATDLIFRVEHFDPEFLSYLGSRWKLDRAQTIHQSAESQLAAVPASGGIRQAAGRSDRGQPAVHREEERAGPQRWKKGGQERPVPVRIGKKVQSLLHAEAIPGRSVLTIRPMAAAFPAGKAIWPGRSGRPGLPGPARTSRGWTEPASSKPLILLRDGGRSPCDGLCPRASGDLGAGRRRVPRVPDLEARTSRHVSCYRIGDLAERTDDPVRERIPRDALRARI